MQQKLTTKGLETNTNYHELTENFQSTNVITSDIYRLQGEFEEFISGKRKGKSVDAVIYDQFGSADDIARYVNGSRKEILESYGFYKDAYPDRSLGLVCKAYYEQLLCKNQSLKSWASV